MDMYASIFFICLQLPLTLLSLYVGMHMERQAWLREYYAWVRGDE